MKLLKRIWNAWKRIWTPQEAKFPMCMTGCRALVSAQELLTTAIDELKTGHRDHHAEVRLLRREMQSYHYMVMKLLDPEITPRDGLRKSDIGLK